jgi:hypothetical protein
MDKRDNDTLSKQKKNTISNKICAKCVHTDMHNISNLSTDLQKVLEAWDDLPEVIREGILAMVNAAKRK